MTTRIASREVSISCLFSRDDGRSCQDEPQSRFFQIPEFSIGSEGMPFKLQGQHRLYYWQCHVLWSCRYSRFPYWLCEYNEMVKRWEKLVDGQRRQNTQNLELQTLRRKFNFEAYSPYWPQKQYILCKLLTDK